MCEAKYYKFLFWSIRYTWIQSIFIVETYLRRKTYQKCSRKFSFHHFSSFKMKCVWEMKKSLPTPMLASGKLYYICCNTIYRNVRPLSLLCDLVWFSIALPVLYSTNASHNLWSSYDGTDKQDAGNWFYILSLSWTLPLEINCQK